VPPAGVLHVGKNCYQPILLIKTIFKMSFNKDDYNKAKQNATIFGTRYGAGFSESCKVIEMTPEARTFSRKSDGKEFTLLLGTVLVNGVPEKVTVNSSLDYVYESGEFDKTYKVRTVKSGDYYNLEFSLGSTEEIEEAQMVEDAE